MTPIAGEYSFGRLKDFTRYSEILKSGEIHLFKGSSRASGGFGLLYIIYLTKEQKRLNK